MGHLAIYLKINFYLKKYYFLKKIFFSFLLYYKNCQFKNYLL